MEKRFNFFQRFLRQLTLLVLAVFYFFLYSTLSGVVLPAKETSLILYSNQDKDDLKKIFLQALKEAKKTIYLEMYSIQDPEVIKKLNEKTAQGVDIFIRFDAGASRSLEQKLLASIHLNPVYFSRGLMHRKILIIDDHLVFLGSANFTTASLQYHDNLVIGIQSDTLACNLEYTPSKIFEERFENKKLTLYLLPQKDKKALEHIKKLIGSAKKSIRVAMFTLTHPELIEALIAAKNRAVEVTIALDYSTALGASSLAVEKVQKAGIPLIFSGGKQLLHHKWAYIDNDILVFGSANWTKSGFNKNEDFTCIIEHLSQEQAAKMEAIWNSIKRSQRLLASLVKKAA